MPIELLSATETAREFLAKAGYLFAQLEEANHDREKDQWRLLFNVGIGVRKQKVVVVDGKTQQVTAIE